MVRLDEYLTTAEFSALEAIRDGKKRPISKDHRDHLLELGYIQESSQESSQEASENVAITDAGQMRLALGICTPNASATTTSRAKST